MNPGNLPKVVRKKPTKSFRIDLAYDLFPVTVARSGLFGGFKDQFTQHLIPDIIGHLICLCLVS